jgi:hypothetical protein
LYYRCSNCPALKKEDEDLDDDELSYTYDNEDNEFKEKRDSSKAKGDE